MADDQWLTQRIRHVVSAAPGWTVYALYRSAAGMPHYAGVFAVVAWGEVERLVRERNATGLLLDYGVSHRWEALIVTDCEFAALEPAEDLRAATNYVTYEIWGPGEPAPIWFGDSADAAHARERYISKLDAGEDPDDRGDGPA